jgi:hypothetical protein
MTKLPIGTKVRVDGPANQPPYEQIEDEGIILDNQDKYLVQLIKGRENLMFRRMHLTPLEPVPKTTRKTKIQQPFDPFDL